jgi:hypothetical protein
VSNQQAAFSSEPDGPLGSGPDVQRLPATEKIGSEGRARAGQ